MSKFVRSLAAARRGLGWLAGRRADTPRGQGRADGLTTHRPLQAMDCRAARQPQRSCRP
jgi:hypothetical protein